MPLEFPFTAKDILLGGVIPAAMAALVCLLSARFLTCGSSRSIVDNWAIAIAFVVGIRLLNLSPLTPATHWHWLPYIGLGCVILSPLLVHRNAVIRCASAVIASGISACLLVPDWDDLPQPRIVMISGFATVLVAVWAAIRPLTQRVERRSLATVFAGSAIGTALILTLAGSLRFGQIGGAIAAGFVGFMVAQVVDRKSDRLSDVSFLFTLLCGSAMFVGQLNSSSDVPFVCFLIPPLAPLALWLCQVGPLSKLQGKHRIVADILLPAIFVVTAIGIAVGTQLFSDSAAY